MFLFQINEVCLHTVFIKVFLKSITVQPDDLFQPCTISEHVHDFLRQISATNLHFIVALSGSSRILGCV